MSAHSGDVNEYFPSIIFLSIIICFLCQKGGQPTNKVNIITPQAHLKNININFYLNKYLNKIIFIIIF